MNVDEPYALSHVGARVVVFVTLRSGLGTR